MASNWASNDTGPSGVCTTPACIHIASEILWSLAPNYTAIDPCTDFDKFACNGWAARNDIPAGQKRTGALAQTNDLNRWTLKGILEGPYPTGTEAGWITVNLTSDQAAADKRIFDKMQTAYKVCLNETAQAPVGLSELTKFLTTIVDSFPVTTQQVGQPVDYSRTEVILEGVSINGLFGLFIAQDDVAPDTNIIIVNPPSFEEVPASNASLAEFFKVSSIFLAAAHPNKITVAEAGTLMQSIVEFENQLGEFAGQAFVDQQENATDDTPQPKMSLGDLNSEAPNLGLPAVIAALAPKGYNVDKMIVEGPTYFKNASLLVANTSTEVLQAFFVWRGIVSLAPYIVSEEASDYNRFQVKVSGSDPDSQQQHWKDCVDFIDKGAFQYWLNDNYGPSGLTWLLGRFFIDKMYSVEARDLTDKILQTLEAEFIARLEDKDWLSDEVKKVAKDKVDHINRKIGYPTSPEAVDPLALEAYYDSVTVTDSYPANVLATARLTVAKAWAQLGTEVDRGQFLLSTPTVNAYYNPPLNEIVVFAGIQQFPIFEYDFPAYLSYGGMGSIVGHEMTHGFDNSGRHYDPTGNFTTWWDAPTIEEFENRTTCFVQQYNNFTITAPNGTAVHVSGRRTLGENLADAGGVKTSFGAWRRWEDERGVRDKQLPGLEHFSNEQLFFLKWATGWCSIVPPDAALELIRTDVHSPAYARILGPLANSRDFREAYNCPVKEPTCELW